MDKKVEKSILYFCYKTVFSFFYFILPKPTAYGFLKKFIRFVATETVDKEIVVMRTFRPAYES